MDLGIAGSTALVTGAAGAIGRESARLLAEEGVRLHLTDVDHGPLQEVVEAFRSDGHTVDGSIADLTDQTEVDGLVRRAAGDGVIEICVHAAGITGAKGDPLDLTDEDWEEAWAIDFMSAVRIARAVMPGMTATGFGRIVYVSSENAVQPCVDEMPYNVAKAALVTFTRGLAQAYGDQGVAVNVVSPAFIESDMTDQMMEQRAESMGVDVETAIETFLEQERPHLVLRRRGRPQEVASTIAYLCSRRASFVIGSNDRVDGGSVLAVDL